MIRIFDSFCPTNYATRFKFGWLFLFLFFVSNACSQDNDSSLVFEIFDRDDIIKFKPEKDEQIYAAGRIMEDKRDIPRVIYVITKDQIALEGYSTLVDVLKDIPGFRVSQPGSAQLGETFLNRGMIGNIYTKILINGVPINPSGAPGMPIGSQLPIKQATRVEIIVDPSSTLYGSDAMAGVINIVLPEIYRPVQVTSDVRLGTNGLTEVSTSIGGKFGRDRNVFSYNLYGTSKYVGNYAIENSQFNVDTAAQNSPFFIGEVDNPSFPEIRSIPHQSSLIGLNATFRGFKVSWNLMHRLDHSALGAHPGRISYANPGNYFGEDIVNGAIQYSRSLNDLWSILVNTSAVAYSVDNNASYVGVNHDLSNGTNYMYGQSFDFRFEPMVRYSKNRTTVLAGGLFTNSSGINFQNFMTRPFITQDHLGTDSAGNLLVNNAVTEGNAIDSTFILDKFNFNTFSLFSQLFYKGEKLSVLAGFRYERRTDIGDAFTTDTGAFSLNTSVAAFNPSVGVLYRFMERFAVRGSYTHAFQTPGPYYQSNNYRTNPPMGPGEPPTDQPFQRFNVLHNPEYLRTTSLGLDYYFDNKSGKIGLSYFRNRLINSLFTEIRAPSATDTVPPMNGYFVGYINRSTESILNGFQLSYFKDFANLSYDIHGAYYIGHEEIEDVSELDSYRSVPTYEVKANAKFRFLDKNAVGCNIQIYGPFVNRVIFAKGELFEDVTGASYNVDIYYHRKFGKNLTASFKVNNLLNSINKGVFTNWLDGYDFNYVPQLQRWFYVNLSYDLN